VTDLNYIQTNYVSSTFPAAANGTPLMWMFDMKASHPSIDWSAVRTRVPAQTFVQENSVGFTYGSSISNGGFAWPHPTDPVTGNPDDWGQSYVTNFNNVAANHPSEYDTGGIWKGFDGSAESWKAGLIKQHCGAVWLKTIAASANAARVPDAVQIATWNDYEEGTAIEPGIDNCMTDITVSLSGTVIGWTPQFTADGASADNVDHYTVWARTSTDQMINVSGPLSATARSFDLSTSQALPPGSYRLHVKAVGKPSMKNTMSSNDAVTYTR